MRSLIPQLRHTVRLLAKSPGFTITAVLILGLGIGANTAIFSLVKAVLLNPLPYPHPERLVQLLQPLKNFDHFIFDYPDYLDYSASQHTFEDITAYTGDDFNLSGRGEPERISGLYVSGNFFRVLGRPFVAGRPFSEAEDRVGTSNVVVISERLWRSRFHANPELIGRNLMLNGRSFEVIGVTPGQADESSRVDLYIPLSQSPQFGSWLTTERGSHNFWCIGRLKQGTTIQAAQADLEVIWQSLVTRYPATNKAFGIRVVPYLDSVMGDYAATIWLLEAAVACLLLITCGNVANLLLARAQERRREVNIRAALGAGRLRLILHLMLESAVLAAVGAIAGASLASWGLSAVRALAPVDIGRFQEVKIDGGAMAFVVIITLATALFSGLFPALVNSNTNLATSLKQEGDRAGTTGRERHRGRVLLATGQVALTCVLLIGAGLLVRTFQTLQNLPLGFNPRRVLTAGLYLADPKYSSDGACQAFFNSLLTKVRQLPGVKAAGLTTNLPFVGNGVNAFGIAGEPDPDPSQVPNLQAQWVTPDYFKALEIPLLRGRLLNEDDGSDQEMVVVISESIAARYFPGQDPIGKQLHDFFDRSSAGLKRHFYTIVGVVGNVQHNSPESEQTPYQAYYPYTQNVVPTPINWGMLAIRTSSDSNVLVEPVRKAVATIDPNLAVYDISTLDDVIAKSFATKRLAAVVVGLFSCAALLLAGVGLYAVLAYSVVQRKREIGVRIALGAQPKSILQLVVTQGLRVVGIGLAIGLVGALAVSHLAASVLFGVSVADPVSIAVSLLIIGFVGSIASLVPALRATRINPITALRE